MAIAPFNAGISSYNSNQYDSNRINESLTTGKKVNSAADNATASAIIEAFSTQIIQQNTASRNTLSGIGVLQTADGAASGINESLQRMNELSVQAQNGTLNDSQRSMLNSEFQQLMQGITQTVDTTQFNGQNLLNDEITSMGISMGDSQSQISLPSLSTDSLAISGLSIGSASGAATAMEAIATAIEQVGSIRSNYGAEQIGLLSAYENQQNQMVNTASSRSQLMDTDYAQAITERTRMDILNQSQLAMMSQSNQNRASVLQLLGS